MKKLTSIGIMLTTALVVSAQESSPQSQADTAAELAKKLANPIAHLISVPLQYNYNEGYGPEGDGSQNLLNIQPVIPFGITGDWNLISRMIIPLIDQKDIPVKGQGESGLGDIVASQFFSPKETGPRGWIWGVGPVELFPTASEDPLGGEKWGLGPTFVCLKQDGPWTVGALVNHIWSVAGDDEQADVNSTFLQPFASYITKTKTTIALNTESTYDWEGEAWSVPVNLVVAQMIKVGKLPMQISVGPRYWVESPDNGPDDWGLRVQVTFLFPE